MKRTTLIFFGMLVMLTMSVCSKDSDNGTDPSVEEGVRTMTWHGWENSVEINNATTKVIVVPAIGRIMYYGFQDGNNVLWNNPQFFGKTLPEGKPYTQNGNVVWANFGGDKVWPTEQSRFPEINGRGWPPDHWFDGGRHDYELLENGVVITSQVSDYCGARISREIILDDETSELTINQTITKVKRAQNNSVEPINFTIWNVTQIRNPLMNLFNLNPNSSLENGYKLWQEEAGANFNVYDNTGVFLPDPGRSQKAGADSDEWLAAIVDNTVIGEFFSYQPGEEYPDGGLSAEVYTSPEYTELELLSPFEKLRIDESLNYTIKWRLHKLPSDASSMDAKRKAAVEWLNSVAQ